MRNGKLCIGARPDWRQMARIRMKARTKEGKILVRLERHLMVQEDGNGLKEGLEGLSVERSEDEGWKGKGEGHLQY